MAKRDLPWKSAIALVLERADGPMHYQSIAETIVSEGIRKSLGATPAATVISYLSYSVKHDGDASPFFRAGKGIYGLRDKPTVGSPNRQDGQAEEDEAAETLVTSFGMFWRRAGVDWKATPKLLGMQSIGATPVDFSPQLGIYLLYDGREVIYVGRSTDRPLGRRLYEHTVDRLSTRWDRFSWFGLLPVSEKGELGTMPTQHDASRIIPALEAVLIEAVEPRQNRKRGDDLASVEFIQKIDPEIDKRQVMKLIEKGFR